MSSRLGARLAALLVPVTLLLPVAAHAEKVVTQDSVGDVVTLVDGSMELEDAVPAPGYQGVDVVRTAVAHGANRLRLTVGFRALEKDPFQFTVLRVSTPRGPFDVVVERLGGKPISSIERRGKTVECGALKSKVDRGAGTLTTSLPTACLDAPRWVQVGVGVVGIAADQDQPELAALYADDAHRDGTVRDALAKGPKVFRG
ncbi:unannotated protein [freshwater metagenome]|uniref:Unannotated protein n=1 Tax=freshwater metagenome TaxID=449393 RepID=A0A6J7H3J6_9ZZZZ|nr:hypothetical protein [Nocardioides lacusdianchii]MSW68628.1 hypothetical protein [Actinomycetota bacterium]